MIDRFISLIDDEKCFRSNTLYYDITTYYPLLNGKSILIDTGDCLKYIYCPKISSSEIFVDIVRENEQRIYKYLLTERDLIPTMTMILNNSGYLRLYNTKNKSGFSSPFCKRERHHQ